MNFAVEVSEVLTRTLDVEGDSGDEALEIVKKLYRDEAVVLDSSDFQEVMFNIKKVGDK